MIRIKNDVEAWTFLLGTSIDLDLIKKRISNDENIKFKDFYLNRINDVDDTIGTVCNYLVNKGAQENENEKASTNSDKNI